MIAKVNFNVVTDLSIKAFGIRKVNLGKKEGKITGEGNTYYYEHNSNNGNKLSFTDVNGDAYNYVEARIYDLDDTKNLFSV